MFQIKLLSFACTVWFCTFQLSSVQGLCGYPACVSQGRGLQIQNTIEKFFVLLNFVSIPDDISDQCQLLLQQAAQCKPKYTGCPDETTLDYSNRFNDPAYVYFLTSTGSHICSHLDRYLKLKTCFTKDLQTSLQKCTHPDGYEIVCIQETFDNGTTCPKDVQQSFRKLFEEWLLNYPYQTRPWS